MGVILLMWILNFRSLVRQVNERAAQQQAQSDVTVIIENVSDALSTTKQEFGMLRNQWPAAGESSPTTAQLQEQLRLIEQRIALEKFLFALNENLRTQAR